MNIYYQWYPGAYWNKASNLVKEKIWKGDVIWLRTFASVFDKIDAWNIWVLPVENSYAWSVHENFYHILWWDYKIIDEIFLDINHYLLANTTDFSKIKEVYSHPQALMQTQNYCENNSLIQNSFGDTAGAAKFVKESDRDDIASVSSDLCSDIYGLNVLDKNIQDQTGNTTRFLVIVKTDVETHCNLSLQNQLTKMSVLFKTKDIPSALYKCLWAFATRFINLTKIESLPAKWNKFEYIFWVDLELNIEKKIINQALEELEFFCKDLKILGEY